MRLIDADKIKIKREYMHDICGSAMIRVEDVARIINDMPTIPQLEWIPCTPESMPEDEYVLISKKPSEMSGNKWSVAIAIRTADPRSRKIQWRDSGFGIIQDDKVLAWMPLPEPYEEAKA